MHILYFCLLSALAFVAVFCQEEPECICFEELESVRGFRNPLALVHANDGTNRRFVAEQLGIVWAVMPNDTVLQEPFLNLTQFILIGEAYDERGFLGIRFHPQHENNRKLYIYYSTLVDNEQSTRLAEVLTLPDNPNKVDISSHRTMLDIEQPFANHNGGDIVFTDDGLMFLFTGDGGAAGDPFNQAQDKTSFLGKVLRIDVDTRTDDKEYGIPPDNPYLDDPLALPELYSIGLRNPWRTGFDSGDRDTGENRGRIFIGDVGQNQWEEIDILESAGNYAWPAREGPECYRLALCGNIGPEVWPIHYYQNTGGGRSITAGHMYRGCESPDFNGWYLFADYMTGQIWRLKENTDNTWNNRELLTCSPEVCTGSLTNEYKREILSWGEDEQGEVYMLTTDMSEPPQSPNGIVLKIVDPSNRGTPCPPRRRP